MSLCNNIIKKEHISSKTIRKFHVENFEPRKEEENEQSSEYIETEKLIKDIYTKEKEVLDEAMIQAEKIKEEANIQGYNKGFEKGNKEGNEKGYKEGYEKAIKEIEIEKKEATKIILEAERIKRQLIGSAEDEVINLVASIIEKVTKIAIYNNDEKIIPIIKNALTDINTRERIIIRVNSVNIQLLKNNEDNFLKLCPSAVFTFLEDNSLDETDCILDSENEMIHLNIESQINNIISEFREKR
jgi:flagellar assembly protein FliH